MIRLVALDIDGTLLPPRTHVDTLPDQSICDAVSALQQAGVVVVLATGRMYPGTAYIGRHLGIDEPMICQQGASVHAPEGELQYGYRIDPSIARELREFAITHDWSLAWFDSERYLVTEPSEQARFFADVSRVEMEISPHPEQSGIEPTGIDIISTPEQAPDIHVLMEARYGARVTLLDFTSVTAFHAPQASKGNAVAALAHDLDIAQSEVLAIGDSVNDVSMLSWAGHSAAPAHCDRYARESAKEILSGGVDAVAERLLAVLDQY